MNTKCIFLSYKWVGSIEEIEENQLQNSGSQINQALPRNHIVLSFTTHQAASFSTMVLVPGSIDSAINYFCTLLSTRLCILNAPGKLVRMLWPMADWADTTQLAQANFVHLDQ